MTRDEAIGLLAKMRPIVRAAGFGGLANEVEDVELRLGISGAVLTQAQRAAWADYFLPGGRRGRVKLVLRPRYEARGLAFLAAVLRSIED